MHSWCGTPMTNDGYAAASGRPLDSAPLGQFLKNGKNNFAWRQQTQQTGRTAVRPVRMSTSRESTRVRPSPNEETPWHDSGASSSAPHAHASYLPKARLTASFTCSRCSVRSVTHPRSCLLVTLPPGLLCPTPSWSVGACAVQPAGPQAGCVVCRHARKPSQIADTTQRALVSCRPKADARQVCRVGCVRSLGAHRGRLCGCCGRHWSCAPADSVEASSAAVSLAARRFASAGAQSHEAILTASWWHCIVQSGTTAW